MDDGGHQGMSGGFCSPGSISCRFLLAAQFDYDLNVKNR
jgi:hypothetical protein